MFKAVLNAGVEQALDVRHGFFTQVLADGVGTQGQGQSAGQFLPPDPQIEHELQLTFAVRELSLVNDQPSVNRFAAVLAGPHCRNDFVERDQHEVEILFQEES